VWDATEIDWGRKLATAGKITGSFGFRNEGNADLRITKVKSSCGCAAVDYDQVVAAGATGKIHFTIDPKRISGRTKKTIWVESNCPDRRLTTLRITGEVYWLIDVKPRRTAYFKSVDQTKPSHTELELVSNADEPLEIRGVTSDSPVFEVTTATVTEGKHYRLEVVAKPPFEPGLNRGTITVATNLDAHPTLTIPVRAMLRPRVRVSPLRLSIRPNVARQADRAIRLLHSGNPPVWIERVTTSDPALKAVVLDAGSAKANRAQITIPADYTPPAGGTVITIETNDPEYKRIEVPVVKTAVRARRSAGLGRRSR